MGTALAPGRLWGGAAFKALWWRAAGAGDKVPFNPFLLRVAVEVADGPCNPAGISGWCDWIN